MKAILAKINKQTLMIAGLCVALVAVGVVNFALTSNTEKTALNLSAQEDVFEVFRQEREVVRAREVSLIESVMESTEVDSSTKNEASLQKLSLADVMEKELKCEGIIKTKLGYDSIVTVKKGSVNIVVKRKELTTGEVAQIVEIVKGETGEGSQNIKIMPQM